MEMVYCIASGSYSDWQINYTFKSEEKRDLLLSKLGEDYQAYDLELCDDKIDVETIETIEVLYVHVVYYHDDPDINYYTHEYKSSSFTLNRSKFQIYDDSISIAFKVTKEQYKHGIDYYKHKYIKICRDYLAQVKIMISEGMNIYEIEDSLNQEECE